MTLRYYSFSLSPSEIFWRSPNPDFEGCRNQVHTLHTLHTLYWWYFTMWIPHNICRKTLHCDQHALLNTPRFVWKRFLSLLWLEMNDQQQREMWCLGVQLSLMNWGVKAGGVTELVHHYSCKAQKAPMDKLLIKDSIPGNFTSEFYHWNKPRSLQEKSWVSG